MSRATTTRRAVVTAAAALPVAAVLPAGAAACLPGFDPYPAIYADWRRAGDVASAARRALEAAEQAMMERGFIVYLTKGKQGRGPEWRRVAAELGLPALQAAENAADEAVSELELALSLTRPTSIEGLACLLRFAADRLIGEWGDPGFQPNLHQVPLVEAIAVADQLAQADGPRP